MKKKSLLASCGHAAVTGITTPTRWTVQGLGLAILGPSVILEAAGFVGKIIGIATLAYGNTIRGTKAHRTIDSRLYRDHKTVKEPEKVEETVEELQEVAPPLTVEGDKIVDHSVNSEHRTVHVEEATPAMTMHSLSDLPAEAFAG